MDKKVTARQIPAIFAVLGAALCLLTGCEPPAIERKFVETPTPTPLPSPTPEPTPYVPAKRLEVGKIFNGVELRTTLETERGASPTTERDTPSSYAVEVKVRVRVPTATSDLAGLATLNGELPSVLPGLADMVASGKVSPFYDDMYRLKTERIKQALNRLDLIPSRHNFYDLETILELRNSQTKRRVLLAQSDMDVDMDGSDGDRMPVMQGGWTNYQPVTSYRWPKTGESPNPFLAPREQKLSVLQTEYDLKGLPEARKRELSAAIGQLKLEIADLKSKSFLLAMNDPFVVVPSSLASQRTEFAPKVGDYCIVVFGGSLYPAIVGDVGPSYKMGEASLRLCQQLNAAATAYNRPVSALKVTYLFFPGTADLPWSQPDLDKWRTRCAALLEEIGGSKGELHTWEDLTKPKPTPTPTPEPSPTASPSAAPSAEPAKSPAGLP